MIQPGNGRGAAMASSDPAAGARASPAAVARLGLAVDRGQAPRWEVLEHVDAQLLLGRRDGQPMPSYAPGAVVDLCWQDADERVHLELRARMLGADPRGLQLLLEPRDAWQQQQLERLLQATRPPRSEPGGPGAEQLRRAQEALQRGLRAELPPRLARLFEQCELALDPARLDFARDIGGIPLAEAERRLRALAPALAEDVLGRVMEAVQGDGGAARPRRAQALRLVDDDEMQVWLNRSESVRRVERDAKAGWHALRPLLVELQRAEPGRDPESLAAEALLDALLAALRSSGLESPLQQLVMRCAARPDALDVPGLYVALQMALLRAGIRAPQRSAGSARAATGTLPSADGLPEPAGEASDEPRPLRPPPPAAVAPAAPQVPAQTAVDAAHRLWSLGVGAAADSPEGGQPISDELLREAVRRTALDGSASDFRERLVDVASELGGGSLRADARQTEAMELLSRLHQALAVDPLLPQPFRDWAQPLMAPILGAQLRPEGLGESAETIRRLLELLEFGSVVCAQRDDAPTRELRTRIEQVIAGLAELPALLPPELDTAATELERLLLRHRRAGSAVEERVVEACVGQQRLIEARREVDRELTERFAGRELPPALIELLDDRLHALLVLPLLREGSDSEAWRQRRTELDRLEQLLALAPGSEARQQASSAALDWIDTLAIGQAGDQVRVQQQVEAVRAALADPDAELSAWPGREQPPAPLIASLDETSDAHAQQLRLMQAGDWLAFDLDRPEPRLLKLAWLAPDRQRFVFVSQLGHKAEDLSDRELLEALRSQRVRLLEDGKSTVVERAWRRMLEGLHDELAEQASRDPLTGLLNRKELDRRLLAWISGRHRPPLALLWVGADHQRILNQSLGLEGGDHALKLLGRVLGEVAREHDPERAYVARIAGDEFAMVLPRCDAALAEQVGQRLRERLESLDAHWQERRFRLSASIGIVVGDENCSGGDALLRDAESACGAAKELGRGRTYLHHADDFRLSQMRETVDWVGKVEQSLQQGQLVLFGQRALSLSDRAKGGPDYLEVLLRMRGGDGVSTPQNFIIAAERYGQITAIDRFVLQQLGLHLMASDASRRFRIAFNLSAHNVVDPEFIAEIIQTLRAQPQPLHQLCIELTETAAIQQLAAASEGMRRLSEAGISLALDDFGSGWSSYNYLRRLPVDIVKVDGAFIKDIAINPQDLALARSINEVAHMLGKLTVAEHIENQATLELVRDIGFDYAQGFFIETPRPLTQHLD
jgi:diguanylate cyclase (GGDEF)-like protein